MKAAAGRVKLCGQEAASLGTYITREKSSVKLYYNRYFLHLGGFLSKTDSEVLQKCISSVLILWGPSYN